MRKHTLAMPVLSAVLAGWAVGATAQDEPGPDGLVTEEVEPGVERIISDDAGHNLDERHPTYHYDMDHVTVAGDGSVLLQSTYHGTDNDAHPRGAFLWMLGEPGTTRLLLTRGADGLEVLGEEEPVDVGRGHVPA